VYLPSNLKADTESMNSLVKFGALIASTGAFSLSSHAELLQHWEFNDAKDVLITNAAVGVPTGPVFTTTSGSTAMTGDGTLRIRRAIGEDSPSQAFLDTSGPQHLRAELTIAGWNFEGPFANEEFRLGFTHATGTLQTADFYVRRTADDEVSMRLAAFGTGAAPAGTYVAIPGLGNLREEPVFIRLEYDGINHQYSGAYNIGAGWVSLMIDGSTSPDTSSARNAGSLRLNALNSFAEAGEYFDIQSLTLTAIPEPSTYAAIFGALALVGAFVYRRRKNRA
jgi:hypothetical protein